MSLSSMFRNIWPYVRPYRWLVISTLALTIVGSLTAQINAWVLRYAIDSLNNVLGVTKDFSEGIRVLIIVASALLSKELLSFIIQFGQKYYGEKLRIYVSRDLFQTVVDRILSYQMAFFGTDNNQPGKLQSRIDRGVDSLTQLMHNFFIDILPPFGVSIVALIIMLKANLYIGLVALIIMPIYYYISRKQAERLKGVRRHVRKLKENKSHGILGILNAMLIIKSFNRQDIESEKQMRLQYDLSETQMKTRKMRFLFEGSKSFVEQIGIVAIIILSAYFISKGEMTIGAIMFYILLFNNVSAPIRQLHRVYDQMNDALIYSENFFDIINAQNNEEEKSGDYRAARITGHFELKNINFTYPNSEKQILKNINIDIQPNKVTSLVGLSGAGKSTLINLLDKFYSPSSGVVLLDGVSLKDYNTKYLRDNIGLVLQKNHIFDGTIEENIGYGNPDACYEDIVVAAKKAYLHDQVMDMPQEYATSALSLSGGQQQKIAIARIFLKNPPIIFLDEPTSSLDAISAEQIKVSLDAIKEGRTVVVISHSISQIIDSDCIYVIEEGAVVESGTHTDIYQLNGTYRKIFDAMVRSLNLDKITQSL